MGGEPTSTVTQPLRDSPVAVTLWTWGLVLATAVLGVTGFVDPRFAPLNYAVTGVVGLGTVVTLVVFGKFNRNIRSLWPAVVLASIGIASYIHSRTAGEAISYAAALVPIGITAAGSVMLPGGGDIRWSVQMVFRCLTGLALCGLAWSLGIAVVSPASMLGALLVFAVACLMRRPQAALTLFLVNVIYLWLNPSSTGLVALLTILGWAALHGLGLRKAFRLGVWGAVVAILALNMVSMLSPEALAPAMDAERSLSGQVNQRSNSEFRLGVIRAASHDYLKSSIWFGKFFTGTINATNVPHYLPWWDKEEAAIHSDFAIMILQGGVVGFVLISAWLLGIFQMLHQGTHRAEAAGDLDTARFLDATLLCGLVVAIFASFNVLLQQLSSVMPFYALVWLGALACIRDYPGSASGADGSHPQGLFRRDRAL